jgi:PKD domain
MLERYSNTVQRQHRQGLLFAAILFGAALSGCGPEQQPNVGPTGSAQVNLNITMPPNVAAVSTPQNRWWATIQQWFFVTEAWAQSVRDISTLVVQVTGPGIPSPITVRQPVTGATGGQVIPVTLDVPVGLERVFTVSGLTAENAAILQGRSAPVTLEVGKTETINIALQNVTAPTANAGQDQGGKLPGARITLDGGASSDPNGDQLTFRWSFATRPAGSQAVLVNPTSVSPTFTVDRDGDYIIQLIVKDGSVDSPPDTVLVSSTNVPPVAEAGQDQGGQRRGARITLNGSASSDPNGDPLTYRWAFTNRPTNSQAVLSNPTNVSPTFTIDQDGDYKIQLIVNDGTVDSPPDIVTVTSANVAPVAEAGPNQAGTFPAGTVITLNGSASSDVNGDPLTYQWAFTTRPSGSQAVLSSATAVSPTFTIDRDGDYIIQLIVNDRRVDSPTDTVLVTSRNIVPVANAGPDQGDKLPGDRITLNGNASADPNGDPLTYRWAFTTQPAGSQAVLSNSTSVLPTFTIDRDGNYVVQLIVNDGTADSPPDTVTITSINVAPVANAGPDQTVSFPNDDAVSLTVTLDGSASSDANRDPLTYRWSFTSSPPAFEGTCEPALQNATSASPSFSPFCSGTYVVQLIVNDGTVDSPPDTVTIRVDDSCCSD